MITVVVPAYNVEKTIARCLDGLLDQSTLSGSYEVIVVDDGSTDATGKIAEERGVRVLRQPNRGAGAARNLGARHAQGDILLFIDADSVPDRCWVQAMAAPFADPAIAGVSGEKKTRQTNLWARYVQLEYDVRYDRIAAYPRIDFVDSSTAGYRRGLFLENGGFDETMGEAEDTDLSFRLAERGYRMVLARDAIAYHTHPESLLEFLRRKYRYSIWRAVVYARHPGKFTSETRTPPTQKVQILMAFALIPLALATLLWRPSGAAAGLLLLLFIASTLPFARRCWQSDRRLGWLAPLTVLLTSFAAGLGALIGMLRLRKSRTIPAGSS